MPHSHEHHGAHHHPGHRHGHGGHGHARDAGEYRLRHCPGHSRSFTVVEAAGGYFANSIALLAEAAHMLADSASLALAVIAIRWGRRPPNERRTYGHRRYQPLAAFINGQALLLLTIWVVYEAIRRLMVLPRVNGRWMLGIAVIGGSRQPCGPAGALSGARTLNERGARAHVLSDLLGSAAATVAALLILFEGWTVVDPLLSLLVSALILRSAWTAHPRVGRCAPAECPARIRCQTHRGRIDRSRSRESSRSTISTSGR